jgi:hypothetical protein
MRMVLNRILKELERKHSFAMAMESRAQNRRATKTETGLQVDLLVHELKLTEVGVRILWVEEVVVSLQAELQVCDLNKLTEAANLEASLHS